MVTVLLSFLSIFIMKNALISVFLNPFKINHARFSYLFISIAAASAASTIFNSLCTGKYCRQWPPLHPLLRDHYFPLKELQLKESFQACNNRIAQHHVSSLRLSGLEERQLFQVRLQRLLGLRCFSMKQPPKKRLNGEGKIWI